MVYILKRLIALVHETNLNIPKNFGEYFKYHLCA